MGDSIYIDAASFRSIGGWTIDQQNVSMTQNIFLQSVGEESLEPSISTFLVLSLKS